MDEARDLRPGMYVLSVDGQKLGRIGRLGDDGFEVVAGSSHPRGFTVPYDEVCSRLKAEIFLLQRFRDYRDRYQPWREAAPKAQVPKGGAGKRFHLFRRVDARW